MGGGVEVGLSLCGLGRAARLVLTFLLRFLLVSPLGRRTNGLPMVNAGWVTRLRPSLRFYSMGAQPV